MKIRKFFGLTSRSVLEQVRNELGADAVIVANRATAEGIEISALPSTAMDTILDEMPRMPRPRSVPATRPAKSDSDAQDATASTRSTPANIAAGDVSAAAALPSTPQPWAP